jgi:hypothetical protein
MFFIRRSSDVPNIKPVCKVGYPDHVFGDIAICTDFSQGQTTVINSVVLREALLQNKPLTEKLLGIRVEPIETTVIDQTVEPAKHRTRKPKINVEGEEGWN